MNEIHTRGWLTTKRVFLAVVFLGVVALSARDVTDPDVWWHLKTGQLIAQTRTVPRVDPFSFTRAGYPWVAHEWLTELFIYGIYRTTGWGGLIVVFAVMVSAAFVLVYLRSAPGYFSGVMVLLGAWATAPLWGVRPQMISLLLTSLWLLILERSEFNRVLLWWTLPLTVVWVNLHAGFALGLALLLLFLAGESLEQFATSVQPNYARLRALAITFAFDLLLVLLNPNSSRMYLYPVETLRSQAVQNYIAEWASPNFHHAEYLPFLVLLLAATACLAWSRSRVRPRDILLLFVGTLAALSAIRMIPLFVLIAVPILTRLVELWVGSGRSGSRGLGSSRFGAGLARATQAGHLWLVPAPFADVLNALILIGFAGLVGFQVDRVVHRQPQVEARNFPSGAVAYLQAHPAAGPLFNLYDWGGYLIWKLDRQTPVFIDGRADLYGDSLMRQFSDTYDLKRDWQKPFQTLKIGTVLVRPDAPLAVALQHVPGWVVQYSDPQAVILERSGHTRENLDNSLLINRLPGFTSRRPEEQAVSLVPKEYARNYSFLLFCRV